MAVGPINPKSFRYYVSTNVTHRCASEAPDAALRHLPCTGVQSRRLAYRASRTSWRHAGTDGSPRYARRDRLLVHFRVSYVGWVDDDTNLASWPRRVPSSSRQATRDSACQHSRAWPSESQWSPPLAARCPKCAATRLHGETRRPQPCRGFRGCPRQRSRHHSDDRPRSSESEDVYLGSECSCPRRVVAVMRWMTSTYSGFNRGAWTCVLSDYLRRNMIELLCPFAVIWGSSKIEI